MNMTSKMEAMVELAITILQSGTECKSIRLLARILRERVSEQQKLGIGCLGGFSIRDGCQEKDDRSYH